MLYATDTAALPHDDLSGAYDLVLLELTFGDRTDHGTAHLDLPAFGHEVARLRAGGRLAPGARVVAVHLSHHNPTDLPDRLAAVGAEALPDGSRVTVGSQPGMAGRRLLVTGGARSGKSRRAESLLAGRQRVTYLATAPAYPDDPEWQSRVAAHRERRPDGWRLVETAAVADVLCDMRAGDSVLVDCLTLWVTAVVDQAGAWEDSSRASSAVDRALAELVAALADTRADVILVSNEVGSGIAPATASGRLFRDLLGTVNTAVAAACDDVEVVTAGIPRTLKGRTWTTST
jgi:adenosylcobinamide kinase/adenosylcobinamide-phosphate guanylyltransferase